MQGTLPGKKRGLVRGRFQAAIVFILPFLMFGLAWFMYFSGQWLPEGRTNKGALLLPPGHFGQLQLIDKNHSFPIKQLEGKWVIVIFGSSHCTGEQCQDVLYKTRQVHIGLGREADRVARVYIAEETPTLDKALVEEHPAVFWLSTQMDSVQKALSLDHWPEDQYFIVDPLGNMMMSYQPGQEGGDLLKDMQRLLKASKIG